jgi:hypothetical protein
MIFPFSFSYYRPVITTILVFIKFYLLQCYIKHLFSFPCILHFLCLFAKPIPDLVICTGQAESSNNSSGQAESSNNCRLLFTGFLVGLLVEIEAICSSETSVTLTGLHGVISQKLELFSALIYSIHYGNEGAS